jgi:hypothetical protein
MNGLALSLRRQGKYAEAECWNGDLLTVAAGPPS